MREIPTSPHFRSASMQTGSRRYWRRLFPETKMKNLMDVLFGFRKKEDADATAAFVAARKEKSLASINESDTTLAQPRVYRTIGLTEARLRARNKQSWMTSTKGWSELFGRFMASAKG